MNRRAGKRALIIERRSLNMTCSESPLTLGSRVAPSGILCYMDEHFDHPSLKTWELCPLGSSHGFQAWRHGLGFHQNKPLRCAQDGCPCPSGPPGNGGDLKQKPRKFVRRSINMKDSVAHAFGSRCGPENNKFNGHSKFLPGNGANSTLTNQRNDKERIQEEGIWQDYGPIFQSANENIRAAIFLGVPILLLPCSRYYRQQDIRRLCGCLPVG